MPETKQTDQQNDQIDNKIVPGLVTGASDNDPAGIATYALSGVRFGYAQLWLLVLTAPVVIAVQSMAARIAIVTKRGLAYNLKNYFSPKIALIPVGAMVVVNILTIGANLAMMAESMALIVPGTNLLHWVVPISFITWYVLVFLNYKDIRIVFFWLIAFFATFVISAFMAQPDWNRVLSSAFIPQIELSKDYLLLALAVVGTTGAPYLMFWEARETIEEKVTIKFARIQNRLQAPGFILSTFISAMIIIVTGTLLFGTINGDVSAAKIAQALEPVAGKHAEVMFAIGVIAAGFLAVSVLAASAASGISGIFEWKEGLSLKPTKAKGFYEVISFSMLVGLQIAISGVDPIKALFYSQVVAGISMPLLLLFLLIIANSKKVMGKYTNGWFDNLFGFLGLLILLAGTIALFVG